MSTSPQPKSPKNYGTIENCDTESNASDDISPHGTDYRDQALTDVHHEPSFDRARRRSFIAEDEDPLQIEPPTMKKKEEKVTWSSLPHKSQLAILTLARLSEPLVQTSLRVSAETCYSTVSRDHILTSDSLTCSINCDHLIEVFQLQPLLLKQESCKVLLLQHNSAQLCYGDDSQTEAAENGSCSSVYPGQRSHVLVSASQEISTRL